MNSNNHELQLGTFTNYTGDNWTATLSNEQLMVTNGTGKPLYFDSHEVPYYFNYVMDTILAKLENGEVKGIELSQAELNWLASVLMDAEKQIDGVS